VPLEYDTQVRLLICILVACLGCRASQSGPAPDFTITSENIGPPLVGFGAELNPYLYCHPNWGDVTEQNVKDLEAKVIALHPQYVRIFMQLGWFDQAHNDEISKDDPRIRESFIRTVRLAQRAGAAVDLSLWFGFWNTPDESMKRYARILSMLVNDEHLDAIRYVTVGNESNAYEETISMQRYNACYLALDRELKRLGMRDHFKIISGGLVAKNQQRWFQNLGANLSQVSDGYSAHMYWDYWDTAKLLRRVSEVRRIVDSLPPDTRRPLFIHEFGVRGKDSETHDPGLDANHVPICDNPMQAEQIAWFMIEAINRGYVATVQWDCYDAWYDRLMHYGTIGDVKSGWKIRPAYHVLRLFTHTTEPGWRAVRIDGTVEDVSVAATRGDDGRSAMYLLNRSDRQKTVRVRAVANTFVTEWLDGTLHKPREIRARDNLLEISIPSHSLAALTSFRPDL
jgi:exo-beta-1,3-glucanase (GH17 family)